MTEASTKKYVAGSLISTDLTVPNAEQIRDFYKAVIGWESEEMPLSDEGGSYADYVLKDAEGNWVSGVCHKRGANQDLPAQWIVYINVADVEQSVKKCIELGGQVLKEAKNADGSYQYALIQDPAGAVLAVTKV